MPIRPGAGILVRPRISGDGFTLAPHVDTLLLDDASPAYVGGQFTLLEQPEMFDRFEANLATGTRAWWDDATPAFITDVARSGHAFYTRLVPRGLSEIVGLDERLATDCRILDTACGTGFGLVRLASTYPSATVVGADGDAHSLDVARERIAAAGRPTVSSSSTLRWRSSTAATSSPWSPTTSRCTSAATPIVSRPTSARRWSPAAGSRSPTSRSPTPTRA